MDDPRRALLLDRLLDLCYDASSYLRRHARPAVRVSAALLVAASLAACGGAGNLQPPGQAPSAAVQPLRQEVRSGLPSVPGRYPVVASSVVRDEQGVYRFSWLPAGAVTTGGTASVSRLRLGQASESMLDVPAQGDPTLYLSPDARVPLVSTPGSTGGAFGGSYGYWYPFFGVRYGGPEYYDPPTHAVSQGGTITGSRVSSAPAAPSARTVGLPHTVSGRAGGTGSGQAASNKSGAGLGESDGKGVAPAKSGGFSGGRGGGDSGASS
jgi:predicted small lipoprotein YifL